MTDCAHPTPLGSTTVEVRVPGANCPWCFNEAMDRVRRLDGIVVVRASIIGECIEIEHRNASLPLVVETLSAYLHGTDDSSHECQMVAVEPEVVSMACGCARPTASDSDDGRGQRVPLETLVEAARRLRSDGYIADFLATADGSLLCRSCETSQAPEDMEIQETVRFEGDSNPDDEAILFALRCSDGCLGQYSSAFGSATSPSDEKAMERLTPALAQPTSPGRHREQIPTE